MFKALFGFLTSIFHFTYSQASCPNVSLGETAEDCPWAEVTRLTEKLTDTAQVKAVMEKEIPNLMRQLREDQKNSSILNYWGISRNADESHLDVPIVPHNILSVLAQEIGFRSYDVNHLKVGHAGLNHTYGYLFSNLQTPFGYKRARYVKNEIETGFGLPAGFLSGSPSEGTLLSNLTHFAAGISMKKRLMKFPFEKLKITRLVETVKTDKVEIIFRTDIVPFLNAPTPQPGKPAPNSALLVYSIDEHSTAPGLSQPNPRLITAFPVQQSFGEGLFKPETFGDAVAIKLKYNAAIISKIPTTASGTWIGKREKLEIQ